MKFYGNLSIGFIISGLYLIGLCAIGYILYEEFFIVLPLVLAGVFAVFLFDFVAFDHFPPAMRKGVLLPQLLAMLVLAAVFIYKYGAVYLTDDFAYRSCIGNSDHVEGVEDCTKLIAKLESGDGFVLKDIPNTKGNYWLAEMLSYRGRHFLRDDKMQAGKDDFKRALLLPEGNAVTVNNLAEAGFTRGDIFQEDYDKSLDALQTVLFCEIAGFKLDSDPTALKNTVGLTVKEAISMCVIATGQDQADCLAFMDGRARDTRVRAGRIYERAPRAAIESDFAQCSIK